MSRLAKRVVGFLCVVILCLSALPAFAADAATVKLNKTGVTVHLKSTEQLTAIVTPASAANQTVTWASSDTKIATVDENGLVTTKKIGTARITASIKGVASATCVVTVKKISVTSVKLNKSKLSLEPGGEYTLTAKVKPSNAGNVTLKWSSSKSSIVKVDQTGKITALKEGKAVIRATSTDGKKVSGTCTVTVKTTPVKAITLNKTTSELLPGSTLQLKATVKPSTATNPAVKWRSSKTSIATVDQTGLITAVSAGTTTITATTDDGKKKAVHTVQVRSTEYTTLTFSAVGDIVLGGDPRKGKPSWDRWLMHLSENGGGSAAVFGSVQDMFKDDDLTLANLECTLSNSTAYRAKPYVLRGKPAYAGMLTDAGIDFVNLANNHTYDCGPKGYSDTVKNLKNAGVGYVDYNSTKVKTVKGVKVGIAGFMTGTINQTEVKKQVSALRKKSDLVIVMFHWGGQPEWKYKVTGTQISIAHAAVDAGADLVLGHHKHLVSGVEIYKGKYIVYDLGNFVTCVLNPDDKDTFIYKHTFKVYKDGFVENQNAYVIPCSTTSDSTQNNCHPVLLTGSDAERVVKKINTYSAQFKKPAAIGLAQ